MATDPTMGLFTTPEQYQEQQRQALYQQAVQEAQLDPYVRARVNLQTGVQGLAQVGAGALGAQDPQLRIQTARQQILQGLDQTDPNSMIQAAQRLAQVGDNQGAQQLAQAAREASLQLAKANQENTAAQKNLREATPAAVREYQVAKAEGFQGSFLDFQTALNQSKRPVTNVNVDTKGETAFAQELGKLDAKKVSDSLTSRDNAIKELSTLQKMAEVVQRPVISGSFAEQRADVSNFFNTIGLSSSADKLKTANSQEYIKYSTGLVLDNLKKTGYNPSNRDMQVVQSIIPRLETDPIARKELITFMASKAKDVVDETTRLEQYARSNKGLSGFTPKVPLVSFSAPSPYANLSDAELAAKIAAARAAAPK